MQKEEDVPRMPDELLSAVLQSKGGPKPFTYGVNPGELKQKICPPSVAKTNKTKEATQSFDQTDADSSAPNSRKTSVGYQQADYRRKADEGPRAEVDTSPLQVQMGTNPNKQSLSFRVLQWMTDTDNTPDQQESTPRTRRTSRDPTVHNAEDDEMRFSGLHPTGAVPARPFRHPQADQRPPHLVHLNHAGPKQPERSGEGMVVETQGGDENSDVRYRGGHIPSKIFQTLQQAVGNTSPQPPSPAEPQQNGDSIYFYTATAPVNQLEDGATDF